MKYDDRISETPRKYRKPPLSWKKTMAIPGGISAYDDQVKVMMQFLHRIVNP